MNPDTLVGGAMVAGSIIALAAAPVGRFLRRTVRIAEHHADAALTDQAADNDWTDILAALGLTPDDIRQRWREREADNRAALAPTLAAIRALPTAEAS